MHLPRRNMLYLIFRKKNSNFHRRSTKSNRDIHVFRSRKKKKRKGRKGRLKDFFSKSVSIMMIRNKGRRREESGDNPLWQAWRGSINRPSRNEREERRAFVEQKQVTAASRHSFFPFFSLAPRPRRSSSPRGLFSRKIHATELRMKSPRLQRNRDKVGEGRVFEREADT